jgi:argininosuccinate synthase
MTRIVLAYSESLVPAGGAMNGADDAIAWLAARYGAEVVTLTLDFGQGRELEALRDRALASGAARAHVLDVADEFAAAFVVPALKAGALAVDGRSNITALGRLIIGQKLVEIARIEQTATVAHGCPPDETRLAAAVTSLDPAFKVLSLPQSLVSTAGRAAARALPESGRRPEAADVELTFARGVPTAVNGVPMGLVDLIGSLDMLVGLGRGARSGLLDTASAAVLHEAHRGLQGATTAQEAAQTIAGDYLRVIDAGAWFSPERPALDRTVDELEASVNGTVRLQLSNEACRIVDVKPLDSVRMLNVR